jgi:hypothetical protein
MANNDNHRKQYRIFDRLTHTWYEVTPEQYKEFDRWRTNLRKREQYWGRCFCPRGKWWLCDGNCLDCEYHSRTADVSLDEPLPNGEGSVGDYIPDDRPTPEEIASDHDLLNRLIIRLHKIDPEADRIIQIWLDHPEGISDRKVAELLGRKQRTFADEMKKFRDEFKDFRNN